MLPGQCQAAPVAGASEHGMRGSEQQRRHAQQVKLSPAVTQLFLSLVKAGKGGWQHQEKCDRT